MFMKERVVPITKISEYFPIALQGPPPDRHDIYVREEVLRTGLQAARLTDHSIHLNFYRNEPRSSVAANGVGGASAVTGEVVGEEAPSQKPKKVHVDPMTEAITWTIPYRDRDVKTPKQTASFGSSAIRRAIQQSPLELYKSRVLFNPEEDEIIEIAHWLYDGFWYIFLDGALSAGNVLIHHPTAIEQVQNSAMVLGVLYVASSITYLLEVNEYRKGNMPENVPLMHLSKDLRRIVYPSIAFDTWIVPAMMYSLRSLAQPDILTT